MLEKTEEAKEKTCWTFFLKQCFFVYSNSFFGSFFHLCRKCPRELLVIFVGLFMLGGLGCGKFFRKFPAKVIKELGEQQVRSNIRCHEQYEQWKILPG